MLLELVSHQNQKMGLSSSTL